MLKTILISPYSCRKLLIPSSKCKLVKFVGPTAIRWNSTKFSTQLAPILLEMFNHSFSQKNLPLSSTEASISLILKPGKDPLECGSYRPISLLNADVKILAKLPGSRLDNVVSQVISIDQTGFMRGLHSFTNIRKLLNVLHSPASRGIPEVVVSLDAEKAFDRIEWGYLFAVLEKFGFGPTFIS